MKAAIQFQIFGIDNDYLLTKISAVLYASYIPIITSLTKYSFNEKRCLLEFHFMANVKHLPEADSMRNAVKNLLKHAVGKDIYERKLNVKTYTKLMSLR